MITNSPVPFIDLGRTVRLVRDEVLKDWEGCLDHSEFVGGPAVTDLERRLVEVLQAPHVLACASGTDALILGLQAMGVRPGMKVAVPNLTFWATYEAVVQIGAVPVLIDIDSGDLQMDFAEFSAAHDQYRFEAAILVHLMGWASARLRDFRELCAARGIRLLEDGAQSFGVEVDGVSVYRDAEVAIVSFYPAKVVGGAMDGGAVLARDIERIQRARTLANHGRASHYSYDHVGWNSRMGGLQARYLHRILDHMDALLESRRRALGWYRELLGAVLPDVRLHVPPEGVQGNGYLAVLTCERAGGEQVLEGMKEHRIGVGRVYPGTLVEQPPCANDLRVSSLERSRAFCRRVFNLPLFYGVTRAEVECSVSSLCQVLQAGR
jgi:dTDP-4-amino-4,6-dideoxygalactose transaminase